MKKTIAIAGLAALIAGTSCSSDISGNIKKGEYIDQNSICSVDNPRNCSQNQKMYSESESVTELTPENFDATVLENKLPVVTEFYAYWCAPCMAYKSIFEKVCAEYEGRLVCAAYNIDQDDEINAVHDRYGVEGIPATRFFNDGMELEKQRFTGGRPKVVLRSIFNAFLEECGN
ncbi:MAG: thioredoxin domain-containing protein [Candidatus Nanoarchaeia archaeon]|jgi:thioredoxin-like negative regulator of GroEL